jgi:hypothetical protein
VPSKQSRKKNGKKTNKQQEKESGKAAVDVLGNQVGKSGGAWVMQVGRGKR